MNCLWLHYLQTNFCLSFEHFAYPRLRMADLDFWCSCSHKSQITPNRGLIPCFCYILSYLQQHCPQLDTIQLW
jgi:hypothetical protein